MERDSHKAFRVWFVEKLIINFALPSDFVYHTMRALLRRDRSQNPFQRVAGLWHGKVDKYQKLLRVKHENGGSIPEEYRELCRQTPCGRVRFFLARLTTASRLRRDTCE